MTEAIINEADQAQQLLRDLLLQVQAEGRRVLVVMGAGCSRAANMPLMHEVFDYLSKLVDSNRPADNSEPCSACPPQPELPRPLDRLTRDLTTLARREGSQSVAARAMALLQRPQLVQNSALRRRIAGIWSDFGVAFLEGRICPGTLPEGASTILETPPTSFHTCVANWTRTGYAIPLSLNFDGLTRTALDDEHDRCMILSSPEHVETYVLSPSSQSRRPPAVIKIWGDIFHAMCHTPHCTSFGVPVALYEMRKESQRQSCTSHTSDQEETQSPGLLALHCPSCGKPRTLQIFFAGYRDKELATRHMLDALSRYMVPSIGGIITAGVSGLWDASLVAFLAYAAKSIATSCCEPSVTGGDNVPRVLCIDCASPDLSQSLQSRGVNTCWLHCKCDLCQVIFPGNPSAITPACEDAPVAVTQGTNTLRWHELHTSNQEKAMWPASLAKAEVWNEESPFRDVFRCLRQLGVKTRLLNPEDSGHNRRIHSISAAQIGLKWLSEVRRRHSSAFQGLAAPMHETVVYLALLFHDLGHLPFTHLTEEAYAELNWTVVDWSEGFSHELGVLTRCYQPLREWAHAAIDDAATALKVPTAFLGQLVTRAIEGRTGLPVIDAIVNSPIDADKVEYIVRDCQQMEEAIRAPIYTWPAAKGWFERIMASTCILPSGLVGLSGSGADCAVNLLNDRAYLYKHLYFRPGLRVIERVMRYLIVRWLVWEVGARISQGLTDGVHTLPEWSSDAWHGLYSPGRIGDTRALKGRVGARVLWESMRVTQDTNLSSGEIALAKSICDCLRPRVRPGSADGVWLEDCLRLLDAVLFASLPSQQTYADFENNLIRNHASMSDRLYVARDHLPRLRELVRVLEVSQVPDALIDIAPLPPFLSYPRARRMGTAGSDCWVVPHKDPDRWSSPPKGRWVPLSETAFGDRDKRRWAQVLVVSPRPDDLSSVRFVEDRLRSACEECGIDLLETDPETINGPL